MMNGSLRLALHLDIGAEDPLLFPTMSYKLCLGLFLILAVIVLGSADDRSQSQDLDLSDKFNRVAREAETTNGKKKIF